MDQKKSGPKMTTDQIIEAAKYCDEEEFEALFDNYELDDLKKMHNFLQNVIKLKQLDKNLIIPTQKYAM